jgi:hypothetical protein
MACSQFLCVDSDHQVMLESPSEGIHRIFVANFAARPGSDAHEEPAILGSHGPQFTRRTSDKLLILRNSVPLAKRSVLNVAFPPIAGIPDEVTTAGGHPG